MTDRTLREKIASIITLDHLQLLSDFDVDGDLYRHDPECGDAAYVTADAILAILDAHTAEPAPAHIAAAACTCGDCGGLVCCQNCGTPPRPAPDAVAEAPCRHEWYQGRCIHCEIAVSDYRHAHSSPLIDASRRLLVIVEGINGAMNHGTWRDERGVRLKDTPEWVAFYNAVKKASR